MGARANAPPSLEQTQTECQVLKRTQHVLYPDMRGASFSKTESHLLKQTLPALEWTMHEFRMLIQKSLPNFSHNTNLSLTCSTSLEAQIKAYL